MRKVKKFRMSSSCKSLCYEEMTEVVGGNNVFKTCDFNTPAESCSGTCGNADYQGECVYGDVGPQKGCYCNIIY